MRFNLTQLQARFAASLVATVGLVLIYLVISHPRLAFAAELSGARDGPILAGEDHNWERIGVFEEVELELTAGQDEIGQVILISTDTAAPPPAMVQRQATSSTSASVSPSTLPGSNQPVNKNIESGETQHWMVKADAGNWTIVDYEYGLPDGFGQAEGSVRSGDNASSNAVKKDSKGSLMSRQTESLTTFYVSINTCLQPRWNATSTQDRAPSQLTLYVSTATASPGPGVSTSAQEVLPLNEGFANYSVAAPFPLYLSVAAPALGDGFSGGWNYELAVSVDDYYHRANNEPFLYLIDTDSASALLVTDNLTSADNGSTVYNQWLNMTPPFTLFAQNTNDDAPLKGVTNSYCGLQNAPAQIAGSQQELDGTVTHVQMDMITRGLGNKPKQQFYVNQLNGSSLYEAFLAMQGNSTASGAGVVGGGGQVWQSVPFQTKSGKQICDI